MGWLRQLLTLKRIISSKLSVSVIVLAWRQWACLLINCASGLEFQWNVTQAHKRLLQLCNPCILQVTHYNRPIFSDWIICSSSKSYLLPIPQMPYLWELIQRWMLRGSVWTCAVCQSLAWHRLLRRQLLSTQRRSLQATRKSAMQSSLNFSGIQSHSTSNVAHSKQREWNTRVHYSHWSACLHPVTERLLKSHITSPECPQANKINVPEY